MVLVNVTLRGHDFYIATTGYVWLFFNAGLVLFATIVFLYYLIRQRAFVDKEHKKSLSLMIAGVVIAYFVTIIIYVIRKTIYAINSTTVLLHIKLLPVAIGTVIMGVSIYLGGVELFYYATEIYSIFIYDKKGFPIYSASFRRASNLEGIMIPSITSAFSSFAGELIGKEVYPKEIDLGLYSLIVEEHGDYLCFVSSNQPTAYLHQGIKNILTNISPELSTKKYQIWLKNT